MRGCALLRREARGGYAGPPDVRAKVRVAALFEEGVQEVEVENAVVAREEALIALVVAVNVSREHLNEGNARVMWWHEHGELLPRKAVHGECRVFDNVFSKRPNFVIEAADFLTVYFKYASQLNDAVLAGVCASCLCVYPEYLLIPHAGPLQFFELFAPADGALFLFRNRPTLFAGAGRFAVTEPFALT